MSKYEKLGNFLLFEKLEEDKLSKNFLAGQIVNNQIQRLNLLKKFDHSLSTLPDFILDLNQEYEILKSLGNPNIVRPNVFVQERSEFAAVFDYLEGKSLRAVFNKCIQDGYPFSADHALLIASRLCTALEYLHSKKMNDQRLVHGFVSPETIYVTYDGEIKLQYLGLAHALLKIPAGKDKLFHDYKNYLAPEVISQQKLDKAADIFCAGLNLFEMLTGESLFAGGRDVSIPQAIEHAQMYSTSGERVPITDEIKNVLSQSLAVDPSQRYAAVGDMRKALDLLLFSSEFSPTTFNLAFFMHSLFRDSIDEENKNLTNFKKIDVTMVVKEQPPPRIEHPVGATPAKDIPVMPVGAGRASEMFSQTEVFSSGGTKEKSKMPLVIGGAVFGALVIGALALFVFPSKKNVPPPMPVRAQTVLPQQQKVDDAERKRLAQEAQAAQEEAKKKDDQLKALQAKLDAILKQQQEAGKKAAAGSAAAPESATPDAATIQKLQEEARRLEEEKKKQQSLAEEKLKAAQTPPPQVEPVSNTSEPPTQMASASPPPSNNTASPPAANPSYNASEKSATPVDASPKPTTQPPIPQPAPEQKVVEGQEVQLTPDVVKPEIVNRINPAYPPIALRKKVEGTVIVSVLVSETGNVAEAKVLRPAAGTQTGFNEAALSAVKKWKFRPAVKDGKRVKVWITYPIVFKLQ